MNMGIAGMPWWTTDIGGFHEGNTEDPVFRENGMPDLLLYKKGLIPGKEFVIIRTNTRGGRVLHEETGGNTRCIVREK